MGKPAEKQVGKEEESQIRLRFFSLPDKKDFAKSPVSPKT